VGLLDHLWLMSEQQLLDGVKLAEQQ